MTFGEALVLREKARAELRGEVLPKLHSQPRGSWCVLISWPHQPPWRKRFWVDTEEGLAAVVRELHPPRPEGAR